MHEPVHYKEVRKRANDAAGKRHVEIVLVKIASFQHDPEILVFVDGVDGPIQLTTANINQIHDGVKQVWQDRYPDLFAVTEGDKS
jgi:hypothetical protein